MLLHKLLGGTCFVTVEADAIELATMLANSQRQGKNFTQPMQCIRVVESKYPCIDILQMECVIEAFFKQLKIISRRRDIHKYVHICM